MATRSSLANTIGISARGNSSSSSSTSEAVPGSMMSGGDHHGGSSRSSRSAHKRIRKAAIESDPEDDEMMTSVPPPPSSSTSAGSVFEAGAAMAAAPSASSSSMYNMDTDISLLEAPTFTTLDRGPSQPMLSLSWDHKLNLLGKKVVNPMIHCCDKCLKPILIYGRMIPCKHVFCLVCAQAPEENACSRCGDKVVRVEQAGLGSIYMCSHGGSRYGNNGCRRTYLSQRDLQAHIQHRHMKSAAPAVSAAAASTLPNLPSAAAIAEATAAIVSARNKQRASDNSVAHSRTAGYDDYSKRPNFGSPPPQMGRGVSSSGYHSNSVGQPQLSSAAAAAATAATGYMAGSNGGHISVIAGGVAPSSSRQSNLITVPIHDQNVVAAPAEVGAFRTPSGSAVYYGGQQQQQQPGATGRTFGGQFSQPPPNYYSQGSVPPQSSLAPSYQTYGPPYEGGGGGGGAPATGASGSSQYSSSSSSAQWRTSAAAAAAAAPSAYYRR